MRHVEESCRRHVEERAIIDMVKQGEREKEDG